MYHSLREAIQRIAESTFHCPNCGKKDLIQKEKQRIAKDESGNLIKDRDEFVMESYDSHRCLNCEQQFTTSVEIIWCTKVEYTDDIGDKIIPNRPLSEML